MPVCIFMFIHISIPFIPRKCLRWLSCRWIIWTVRRPAGRSQPFKTAALTFQVLSTAMQPRELLVKMTFSASYQLCLEHIGHPIQYFYKSQSAVYQCYRYRANNYSYCIFKMAHNHFLQIIFSHSIARKFGCTGFIRRTIPLFCQLSL